MACDRTIPSRANKISFGVTQSGSARRIVIWPGIRLFLSPPQSAQPSPRVPGACRFVPSGPCPGAPSGRICHQVIFQCRALQSFWPWAAAPAAHPAAMAHAMTILDVRIISISINSRAPAPSPASRLEALADPLQKCLYFLAKSMYFRLVDQLQYNLGIHEHDRDSSVGFFTHHHVARQ